MDLVRPEYASVHATYLRGILLGSLEVCVSVIDRLTAQGISPDLIVENVMVPALVSVGELWESKEIGVGQEHLATSVCERAVQYLFPPIVRGLDGTRRVLLINAPGNRHSLGLRILSHVLETRKFYVDYLGGETPSEEAVSFAQITRPRVVGISISIKEQIPATRQLVTRLRSLLPGVKIIAGGNSRLIVDDLAAQCGADASPRWYQDAVGLLETWLAPADVVSIETFVAPITSH